MTDSRPEITLRGEAPFIVVKITWTASNGRDQIERWPMSLDEAKQLLTCLKSELALVEQIIEARLKMVAEVCGKEEPESTRVSFRVWT